MPIKIPNELPASQVLKSENIFVMHEARAISQDIRPLKILLLNLMPKKIETETQISRLISNTPLQIELELICTATHEAKNTPEDHMISFYKTFKDVKENRYDGMIITGAPIEFMEFEEVDYWPELAEIMEWSKTHVHSTLHICWGAQAGLYYHFGIQKRVLPEKMFGVFPHKVDYKKSILFRGFDDIFMVPHSRHTTVYREDVEKQPEIKILSSSEIAGLYACMTKRGRQIFIMGHSEYDARTLEAEYQRDKNAGKPISVPKNYYPNDDDTKAPMVTWRSSGNLLYANWINYIVYQGTPYDLEEIGKTDTFEEE